ncbi:MAG: J domain-containing protein [Desulfuromonadia bacterium]
MSPFDHEQLASACRFLFGDEIACSPDFFTYIQPEGVRRAFRDRARKTHPDCCASTDSGEFIRVRESYELLTRFLDHRRTSSSTPTPSGSAINQPSRADRPLLFGRFLYRSGIITFPQLLSALAWQRSTYPRIGILARERCGLATADVRRVIFSPTPGRFGEKAVKSGLLSSEQVRRLLLLQQFHKKPLGQYFVEERILSGDELLRLVREQRLYNASRR